MERTPLWMTRTGWLTIALYAGLLAYLSHQSHPSLSPPESWGPFADKWAHALAYAGLTSLLAAVFTLTNSSWSRRRRLETAWLISAFYAVSDELHQGWIPGREMDSLDWLADVTGSGLLCLLGYTVLPSLSVLLTQLDQTRADQPK